MAHDPVLVTGATGSVGRQVVEGLRAAGTPVRALTRTPDKADLPPDVEVVGGDLGSAPETAPALDGVRRLYLFPAPELAGALEAAVDAGVEHVVLLSSMAVTSSEGGSSADKHQACERAVAATGLPHTCVRAGAFMGNDLLWAAQIQTVGSVSAPYPEAATAPVDERDVAALAVAALLDPAAVPGEPNLTGPESLTQRRRVEIISEVLGRDIVFDEQTPEQARTQLGSFLPEVAVELILTVLRTAPAEVPTHPLDPALAGREPYGYRDWVAAHLAAFRA